METTSLHYSITAPPLGGVELPLVQMSEMITALANDGPNPEYPWPHAKPEVAPVNHDFAIWATLTSGRGRDLMRVIHIAVNRFPEYADT